MTDQIVAQYFGIWGDQTWNQRLRQDTPFDECTRLYLAFGKIVQSDSHDFGIAIDGDPDHVTQLMSQARNLNPAIEIYLTVGGDGGGTSYGGAAQDSGFAHRVRDFLTETGLDGLDVDWEQDLDRDLLNKLISNLSAELRDKNLGLTLDVWPYVDAAYDMHLLSEKLDAVNIMSYGTGLDLATIAKSYHEAGLPYKQMIGGIITDVGYNQFGGTVDTLGADGTIAAKANFALEAGLAGMMSWRLDCDYISPDNPDYPTYQGARALWAYLVTIRRGYACQLI